MTSVDLVQIAQRNVSLARDVCDVLKRSGRVHVANFLPPDAATALLKAVEAVDWKIVTQGEDNTYDFTPVQLSALDEMRQRRLLDAIHARAGAGFEFLFDNYRISDEVESGALKEGELAEFFSAWNSETWLTFMRQLTGDHRIVYADAQATRYRPGHFLTEHDDDIEGKNRLFAYVLNLTPVWRSDWGGLLMFQGPDGHVLEAYTPKFGALNILRVPQPHSVSMVTPFAAGFRYSITGWLRSAEPL